MRSHFEAHRISILLFLLVGTLSAIVNLSSFALLWEIIHLNYQTAVSIAYVLSVIVHFIANRRYTFKNKDPALLKQMSKYVVMIAINYVVTITIVKFVVEGLNLSPYLGIIAAIGGTVVIGYSLSRFWIFPMK